MKHQSLVAIFILLLLGCNNDLQMSSKNSSPILVDGRLSFDKYSSISSYLNNLQNEVGNKLPEKIVNTFESKGFSSHYSIRSVDNSKKSNNAYLRIYSGDDISEYLTPEEDSVRLLPIIDPALASLLNDSQEIQIGSDSIYRVQMDYTFKYPINNDSELVKKWYMALKAGNTIKPSESSPVSFEDGRLLVYKTKVTLNGGKSTQANGRQNAAARGGYCENYFSLSPLKIRMESNVYTINTFFYASVGIETNLKKEYRDCNWFRCKNVWDWDRYYLASQMAYSCAFYVTYNGGSRGYYEDYKDRKSVV